MSFFTELSTPNKLFILAGMPGCGKSTWARTFFEPERIVSSDGIRAEKWPDEPYDPTRNAEVFRVFHDRIDYRLCYQSEAVADATSLSWTARQQLLLIAKWNVAETHLIFFNNPVQALQRNAKREGNACVPPNAMMYMLEKYQETRDAILEEDYTSITVIEGIQ